MTTGNPTSTDVQATITMTETIRGVVLEHLIVSDWHKLEPGVQALVARLWSSQTPQEHRSAPIFTYRLGALFVSAGVQLLPHVAIDELCKRLDADALLHRGDVPPQTNAGQEG